MKVDKEYVSPVAQRLLKSNRFANQAYHEIISSILSIVNDADGNFTINSKEKNCNGVVPIKEKCYMQLENDFLWFREKPLNYLHHELKKGGPIDVYKEFINERNGQTIFRVGLEFETGNISSAHRSMNKLSIGLIKAELDMVFLMMPVKKLSYYLTDRVSNYEELEPYFVLLDNMPFIVFGFDADLYSTEAEVLPKGSDGMSSRALRKWKDK